MSKKVQKDTNRSQHDRRRRRHARRFLGWWVVSLAIVIVMGGGWFIVRNRAESPSSSGLPSPVGGRDVAQDVNTMVGQRAPSFSLATASGQAHTVTSGRGRPTVLIFHMGIA